MTKHKKAGTSFADHRPTDHCLICRLQQADRQESRYER